MYWIAALIVLAIFGFLTYEIFTAPNGHEDEAGFHVDKEKPL